VESVGHTYYDGIVKKKHLSHWALKSINYICIYMSDQVLSTEIKGKITREIVDIHIVTGGVVHVTQLMISSSDDWIYWHFGYTLSLNHT
jgi:hypothetical protein